MDVDLKNTLVIDIETVSCVEKYEQLDERMKSLWDKKSTGFKEADVKSSSELFKERAGIYAEFGQVVVIALGYFIIGTGDDKIGLRIKAFSDQDEEKLLKDFIYLLENKFDQENLILCAHNGKEFDFPYLCRRMLVHGIPLPHVLDISGKKPWDIKHVDTMELWKFGDRKSFTSLDLLASLFQIPSSKDEIDGSMVSPVYYQGNGLERIATYCMHDVAVTAQVFLKLNNIQNFDTNNINYLPVND